MRLRMKVPIGRRASGALISARVVAAVLVGLVHVNASRAAAQVRLVSWPSPDVTYATGQGAKLTGPIVSRRGDDFLVQDETTKRLSIVSITPTTKISQPTGFLKMESKPRDRSVLIPGLVIVVKGNGGNHGNLVADKISFHKSSLKTASQIAAGEVDVKALARSNSDSIAAAKERARIARDRALDSLDKVNASVSNIDARLSNLDAYDTKFTTAVFFETNSAMLSAAGKMALDDLASRAQGVDGYKIVVAGFADATGSSELNQRLSLTRADAVITYLTSTRSVPMTRIVSPAGQGTSNPVASNDTPNGRAQNRRAEVKIVVNRGINPRP